MISVINHDISVDLLIINLCMALTIKSLISESYNDIASSLKGYDQAIYLSKKYLSNDYHFTKALSETI
jgi:hypothetical protein